MDLEIERVKKGSMTIEAACLMSLILLVLMGTIYLFFFVHNRAWLTAAAYEAAVSGEMEAVKEDGEPYLKARTKAEALGSSGFFGAENLQMTADAGKTVKVVYELDTVSSYGGLSWHMKAEGEARVVQPVKWIRKIRAAKDVWEEAVN